MTKKMMFAIAALLGFSTACSSARKLPQKSDEKKKSADTTFVMGVTTPDTMRMVVMYGVPIPKADTTGGQRLHLGIGADELTPLTEPTHDENDPQPAKSSSQVPKPTAQ